MITPEEGKLIYIQRRGEGGQFPRPLSEYGASRFFQQAKACREAELEEYRQRHARRHQNKKRR